MGPAPRGGAAPCPPAPVCGRTPLPEAPASHRLDRNRGFGNAPCSRVHPSRRRDRRPPPLPVQGDSFDAFRNPVVAGRPFMHAGRAGVRAGQVAGAPDPRDQPVHARRYLRSSDAAVHRAGREGARHATGHREPAGGGRVHRQRRGGAGPGGRLHAAGDHYRPRRDRPGAVREAPVRRREGLHLPVHVRRRADPCRGERQVADQDDPGLRRRRQEVSADLRQQRHRQRRPSNGCTICRRGGRAPDARAVQGRARGAGEHRLRRSRVALEHAGRARGRAEGWRDPRHRGHLAGSRTAVPRDPDPARTRLPGRGGDQLVPACSPSPG